MCKRRDLAGMAGTAPSPPVRVYICGGDRVSREIQKGRDVFNSSVNRALLIGTGNGLFAACDLTAEAVG